MTENPLLNPGVENKQEHDSQTLQSLIENGLTAELNVREVLEEISLPAPRRKSPTPNRGTGPLKPLSKER